LGIDITTEAQGKRCVESHVNKSLLSEAIWLRAL